MEHADVASGAAIAGAAGVALLLMRRERGPLLAGLALLAGGMGGLAYALVPGGDLRALVDSPARIGAVCVLGVALVGLAVLLARLPALVPVCALAAAPFRVPVTIGEQEAFLLVPLYAVLAAAALAFLVRVLRGGELRPLPRPLAWPAAAFVGLSALSLLWAGDPRSGSIQLLFFLLPFGALLAVVARAPAAAWWSRSLAATLVVLACAFAVIGISQLWTERLYFARDLEVANAYTTYFRTTSLFADSSIYARQLVLAIVVLVVALWLARIRLALALALLALLWTGLFFSYSQSAMVALVVSTLAVSFVAADRTSRRALAAGALAVALAAGAFVGVVVRDQPLDRLTSGRSPLVAGTWNVFVDHPLVGVGVGSQPQASQERSGVKDRDKYASHTTPLTVAAELGVLGLAAHVAFLAGAARLLVTAFRRVPALGLGLGAVFLLLVAHSLFYSGFFEDPLTWGVLAVAAAVLFPQPGASTRAP
ncbi:MAG: O-antigen ligase family protein [Thermoleophilia bacterium]|nr:O-antigen ligase family protein [Thermoleophilia bacterium]